MVKSILHKIIANPWAYEQVRRLVGARHINRRLAHRIAALPSLSLVLDLGGGTGVLQSLCPPTSKYVCLDTDLLKLRGFLSAYPDGCAVLSDASRAPLKSQSADLVLCSLVSHHLSDDVLARFLEESWRLLRSNATFIFVDAVWEPARWAGRMLWKLDRGAYPRTAEALRVVFSKYYSIVEWERFVIYHEYVLCVAAKRATY